MSMHVSPVGPCNVLSRFRKTTSAAHPSAMSRLHIPVYNVEREEMVLLSRHGAR